MPEDMRLFYQAFDGVRLFGAEYVLLDPDAFLPFEVAVRATTGRALNLNPSWVWFCRTRAGYHVGIDLRRRPFRSYRVSAYACIEGASPRLRPVARGFTEFLTRAMQASDHPFWCTDDRGVGHR